MPLQLVVAKRHGLLAGLLILAGTLSAQSDTSQYLTLNNAVRLSIQQYPTIQSQQARLNAAKASLEETRKAWLPNLRVSDQLDLGSNNSLNGSYFPMGLVPSSSGGRRPENKSQAASGNIATLGADWEIYNFGGYTARNKEAEAAVNIQQQRLGVESYNIQSVVIGTYLDLVKFRRLAGLQQKNIDRTELILKAISAFVGSGLKPAVDSAIAAAELSKARLTYIDLRNTVQRLKLQLAALTGLDSSKVKTDTTVDILHKINLAMAVYTDSGYLQHPLLQFQQAVYRDNLALETVVRKSYLPKINLMASGWMRGSSISPADEYKALAGGFGFSRYNYLTGIAITYNFTDLKRTQLKLHTQQYRSIAALQDFNEEKLQLSTAEAQANTDLLSAIDKLKEIPAQKNAASSAYAQKNALYQAGLTNIVELTNALYLLNRAETDEVLVADEAWKAFYRKMYAGNQVSQFLSLFK